MAINTDQLLNRSSGRLAMQKAQQKKMVGGASVNIVLTKKSIKNVDIIKTNVVKIESFFKGTLALDKKQLDDKKRATSRKRKDDIETKLETKPNAESGGKVKLPAAPRMGILDWIKNFIGNIILGYFVVRLIDHLPKIMPILKFLGGAADFIIDIGGKLLNGLVTFIDIGYKAYDATRGFLKSFGGENFVKVFDAFNGAVGSVIEAAIIASIALASQGKDGVLDIGMDLLKDRLLGQGAQAATSSSASAAAGGGASTAGGTAAQAGGLGAGAVAAVVAGAGLLSSALGEGAFQVRKFAVKPIQKLENDQKNDKNPFTRFGRGVALNMIRPLFGLFQTVGVLLDIVGAPFRYAIELLRYPFLSEEDKVKQAGNLAKFDARIREDFRKALNMLTFGLAFKEKGSFGNIYGNQGAQKEMMGKMAGGGITRGGKSAGGAKRSFGGMKKKETYKRRIAQKPSQVQIKPGADVGGEDKIFGIFPNPLKAAKKVIDTVNPFNIIKTTGEDLGKTDYFGPILAITSKMILGQQPDQMDYKNVGLGLNLLIAKGVQDGQLKGGIIPAFADGGLVDPDVLSAVETGGDISSWVSNVFRGEIETGAQKTMRLIKENMAKKKTETDPPPPPPPGGGGAADGGDDGGGLTAGQWGPMLDLISSGEGGYTSVNPGLVRPGILDMNLQQLLSFKAQSKRTHGGSAALGRYQFINPELAYSLGGINPNEKFTKANQDKMAVGYLEKKRPGKDWLAGKITTRQYIEELSNEWGAFRSYSGNVLPGNSGKIGPEKIEAALNKVKKGGYGQAEIAKSQAGSSAPGMSVSTSAASGPAGDRQKNAGDLGSFIKSLGVARGSGVHEHPQHGGIKHQHRGRGHYEGRAIDIGGYGGKYGRAETKRKGISYIDDQPAILAGINKFAQKTGKKPSLVLHGDNDRGHWDHVHAEYSKGGETLDGPHLAMLGEKGKEIVIDADSAGPAKDMLLAINQAKGYKGVMAAISQYAPYDAMSPQTIIIPSPSTPEEDGYDSGMSGGGVAFMPIGGGDADPFITLYQGG